VPLRESRRGSSRADCNVGKCIERTVGDIYSWLHQQIEIELATGRPDTHIPQNGALSSEVSGEVACAGVKINGVEGQLIALLVNLSFAMQDQRNQRESEGNRTAVATEVIFLRIASIT
jgi:hypothetical protein